MNVLLHVPDKLRIENAFSNAKNILKGIGHPCRIQIVFNANAVADVLDKVIPDELTGRQEIDLILCHNTMKANNIPTDRISNQFTIVPAAVIYIIEEQRNGAIYIRP